ncbi:MAG: class I SAM-dependent methyltransferase [Hyphomicrobiaceae bacterium]
MTSAQTFQTERNALYNRYHAYRELPIPFSVECAISLTMQLQIQEALGVKGDFLEAGVQHGGTAFLALTAGRAGEKHVLIDMERSKRFTAGVDKMPEAVRREVDFRECMTSSPTLVDIEKRRFRWIHIDAGHLYDEVAYDIGRYAPLLSADGIIVLDDFFQWRWPEVTEAIQEYFTSRRNEFAPLVMGFNKISFCRVGMHETYRKEVEKRAVAYYDDVGNFLLFRKKYLGAKCFSFTGTVAQKFRAERLPDEKFPGTLARIADT